MASLQMATSKMNLPTNSSVDTEDLSLLVQELRELGFDAIRFASYRTAAKLRYIQKKSNFELLDLWNVIESIRDNGLNVLDPYFIITVAKLESVVTSMYINLNKRLPQNQQVDVLSCSRYLLSWLLIAYDSENSGRIRVFSVKVGLVTLCYGKLVDKLRYIFSQISDENGCLVFSRFTEYLQELLALPTMVLESPTFGYTEGLAATIFDGNNKVYVNGFLDALLSDPGPPCLMWMPLLHAMATVEEVNHPVPCSVCKVGSIQGFRYKCQKCSNFNMCQNCFWQGKTSENHGTDHEVKEYSTFKSGGRSLRNSFRKSFRCVPEKAKRMPRFPDQPERPLNLSHIVPPSPLPVHNFHNGFQPYDTWDAYTDQQMFANFEANRCPPNKSGSYTDSLSESDEEHRLIARYTARLASESKYPPAPAPVYKPMQHSRTMSQSSMNFYDTTSNQRQLIAQLENRNREIVGEIARLRAQQELDYMNGEPIRPALVEELQALRYHKSDLEEKLYCLQDSRRHLMGQMETLMKLLKTQNSTSSLSRISRSKKSVPTYAGYGSLNRDHHRSAPATPHRSDPFSTFSGDLRAGLSNSEEDFAINSELNNDYYRRNDLLLAADSVTSAMSSLVKELNTVGPDEAEVSEQDLIKSLETECLNSLDEPVEPWKQVLEQSIEDDAKYLAELKAQRYANASGSNPFEVGTEKDTPIKLSPSNGNTNGGATEPELLASEYDDLNEQHERFLEQQKELLAANTATEEQNESYFRSECEASNGGDDWNNDLKTWIRN